MPRLRSPRSVQAQFRGLILLLAGLLAVAFMIYRNNVWTSQHLTKKGRLAYGSVAGISVPVGLASVDNSVAVGSSSSKVIPWWRCSGSHWFEWRINALNAHEFFSAVDAADERLDGGYATLFRVRSVQKFHALVTQQQPPTGVEFSQAALDIVAPVRRVVEWPTARDGVNGLVDIGPVTGEHTDVVNQAISYEYADDLMREPKIWRRVDLSSGDTSAATRVVFVTTAFRRPRNMQRYAAALRELLNSGETQTSAVMVLFGSEETLEAGELQAVKELRSLGTTILFHPLPFAKVSALTMALQDGGIQPNDIVFFNDIDVTFPVNASTLARRYCRLGSRGYAPIVWYRSQDETSANYPGIGEEFATGGTGIIALYKADLDAFGGYDQAAFGASHGFEDTDFFFRARYHGIHLVRLRERSMWHWPHFRDVWQSGQDIIVKSEASDGCYAVEQMLRDQLTV